MRHSSARKVRLAACLAALAATSAHAAPPATRTPASLVDEAARQFASCLQPVAPSAPRGPIAPQPPGIGRGGQVAAILVPTREGRLYSYTDKGGSEIVCGIALYGVDAGSIERRIVKVIKATHKFAFAPAAYRIGEIPAGRVAYWGDPRAPGLYGITIVRRPPSAAAPSLQIELHKILMH